MKHTHFTTAKLKATFRVTPVLWIKDTAVIKYRSGFTVTQIHHQDRELCTTQLDSAVAYANSLLKAGVK